MTERPIILNAWEVRAILAGTKTQIRRPIPETWWRCLDPEDTDDREIAVLERGVLTTATLTGDPAFRTEPGAGTPALLTQKLDAGGFSAVSSTSAADLRDKADYLGVLWNNKYGRDKGLERYGHIRSLVLSDCARAFEDTRVEGQIFGVRMLARLRARFQERRGGSTQLFECSDEHLEGFAYSLTSECKVHWSNERPWERG